MTSALPQAREEEYEKNGFQKWCKVPSSLALGPLTRNKRRPRHQRLNELLPSPLWHMLTRCRPDQEEKPSRGFHTSCTQENPWGWGGTLPTPAKLVWAPRSASWAEQRLLWVGPQQEIEHQRPLMGVRTTASKLFYSERWLIWKRGPTVHLGLGTIQHFLRHCQYQSLGSDVILFFYSRCYKTS